ncbi:MAG: hypothetical protein VW238_02910 [Nitrosomonadales bacterium]
MILEKFSYHINWKSRGTHPGLHKSSQRGMGIEFAGHSNLLDYPDPRRIDIRMSIQDPSEQIYVKIFNQRSATPVMIFSDLSSSMTFGSQNNKYQQMAYIAKVIQNSVSDNSDAIGFIGFEDIINDDWIAPLSYKPYKTIELIEKLKDYSSLNKSNKGMNLIHRYLPSDKTLIFMISDFHMPIDEIELFLKNTSRHRVVPIVLWNSSEYKKLPKFGIVNFTDPETNEDNIIFLRKKLLKNINENFLQRKNELVKTFNKYNAPAFFVEDQFIPEKMTDYFNSYYHA